jgi:hypothetical protein
MAIKITLARNLWNCVLYTKSISFIYAFIHHTFANLMIWGLIVILSVVGLTRDFQTVGYVHVGNEVFIRAGAAH